MTNALFYPNSLVVHRARNKRGLRVRKNVKGSKIKGGIRTFDFARKGVESDLCDLVRTEGTILHCTQTRTHP